MLNHGLLRTLGVSHDSIEAVVSILKQHGFKGKLTGAGGGGCLFALIKPGAFSLNIILYLISICINVYIIKTGFLYFRYVFFEKLSRLPACCGPNITLLHPSPA